MTTTATTTIGLKPIADHATPAAAFEHLCEISDRLEQKMLDVDALMDSIEPLMRADEPLTEEQLAEAKRISCLFPSIGTTEFSEDVGAICDDLYGIARVLDGSLIKIRGEWCGRDDEVAMEQNRLKPY
jgi:hypothetical protein